jgi:hypothetical protein
MKWELVDSRYVSGPYEVRHEGGFWQCAYGGHLLGSSETFPEQMVARHMERTRAAMQDRVADVCRYFTLNRDYALMDRWIAQIQATRSTDGSGP